MPSRRQRRKQRQQDRPVNADVEREAGGVAEDLHDEADAAAEPAPAAAEQPEEDRVGPAELIGAIGPLRRSRNEHPLLPGIRLFTAMLDEARGGYVADRLAELEDALDVEFNPLEQDGIVRIATSSLDEHGVPDVEHGVQICLEVRGEAVAEDHGDEEESPPAADDAPEPEPEPAVASGSGDDEFADEPGPDEA